MALEIERNRAGFWTLAETSGATAGRERMHPLGDPLEEGRLLYVEPTRMGSRLLERTTETLRVWDVGLGLGANALAAIRHRRSAPGPRAIHILSFENQFEGFLRVAGRPDLFAHAGDTAIQKFAAEGFHEEPGIVWQLVAGDFFETALSQPGPEIIFFDPFSRNTNPRFWTADNFAFLLGKCGGRACLSTYANARAVREAMQVAGWRVARGPGYGNRGQTTIAVTAEEAKSAPDYDWWP